MKLLLSPHNDDETLFASYIILRESPLVVTVLDGAHKRHNPTPEARVVESKNAMKVLGADYEHLWLPLDAPAWQESAALRIEGLDLVDVEHVWAPFPEPGGHRHHNRLGELATRLWPGKVSFYSTYT